MLKYFQFLSLNEKFVLVSSRLYKTWTQCSMGNNMKLWNAANFSALMLEYSKLSACSLNFSLINIIKWTFDSGMPSNARKSRALKSYNISNVSLQFNEFAINQRVECVNFLVHTLIAKVLQLVECLIGVVILFC